MGTESVNVVSETLNTMPARVLKPVLGNSIGRPTGLTLGQMAVSAAANDPVEWSAAAATNGAAAGSELAAGPAGSYQGESAGTVLASAEELLVIDLALSDPLNAELITQLSPGEVSASSEFSQQLIERYGEHRFAQLKHLQEAHERARDQFRDALNLRSRPAAECSSPPTTPSSTLSHAPPLPASTPPGWRLEAVDRYESGGEAGALYRGTEFQWRFDSAEFVRWYGQQPGIIAPGFSRNVRPGGG